MLSKVLATRSLLEGYDLAFLGGVPAIYHCHHFNLFLDQTIDDALGPTAGLAVRHDAAREVGHQFIAALAGPAEAVSPPERIALAQGLFSAMGHGRLAFDAGATGGKITGEYLHYGFAWGEKYGQRVTRRRPADAFAAGFGAGAIEAAYGVRRGSLCASETKCIALREPQCEFDVQPDTTTAQPRPFVDDAATKQQLPPSFVGQNEESVAGIGAGLREFAGGIAGDERGLVQAFGVFVTMQNPTYYNRISYDAFDIVRKRSPKSVPVLEALLRESGHVCGFNTFGGILSSPEWEGMVGPLRSDAREIVTGCCAIARALGFGHWVIEQLLPGQRLVLRAPLTYESAYCKSRKRVSDRPACYLFQGASLATMQLAHRVQWEDKPALTQDFYLSLFSDGELPWAVEETHCVARGDEYCRTVVEARKV